MKFENILLCVFLPSASSLEVWVWGEKGCHGDHAFIIRKLNLTDADGCFKKGELQIDLQLENEFGVTEQAVAVYPTISNAAQMVAFFTSDDCDPDNAIEDGWIDGETWDRTSCSGTGDFAERVEDYQSWTVWDMCEGQLGCTLE
jgi:hypothetical protein